MHSPFPVPTAVRYWKRSGAPSGSSTAGKTPALLFGRFDRGQSPSRLAVAQAAALARQRPDRASAWLGQRVRG